VVLESALFGKKAEMEPPFWSPALLVGTSEFNMYSKCSNESVTLFGARHSFLIAHRKSFDHPAITLIFDEGIFTVLGVTYPFALIELACDSLGARVRHQ
jgi:hypothetical protein